MVVEEEIVITIVAAAVGAQTVSAAIVIISMIKEKSLPDLTTGNIKINRVNIGV